MKTIRVLCRILEVLFLATGIALAQDSRHEWIDLVDYKTKGYGYGFELHERIEEKILAECEKGSIIVDVSHAIFGQSLKKDYLYIELAIHHPGHWEGKSYSRLIAQKDIYSDWSTCRILIPSPEARNQFFTRDIGTKAVEDAVIESESGIWKNMKR